MNATIVGTGIPPVPPHDEPLHSEARLHWPGWPVLRLPTPLELIVFVLFFYNLTNFMVPRIVPMVQSRVSEGTADRIGVVITSWGYVLPEKPVNLTNFNLTEMDAPKLQAHMNEMANNLKNFGDDYKKTSTSQNKGLDTLEKDFKHTREKVYTNEQNEKNNKLRLQDLTKDVEKLKTSHNSLIQTLPDHVRDGVEEVLKAEQPSLEEAAKKAAEAVVGKAKLQGGSGKIDEGVLSKVVSAEVEKQFKEQSSKLPTKESTQKMAKELVQEQIKEVGGITKDDAESLALKALEDAIQKLDFAKTGSGDEAKWKVFVHGAITEKFKDHKSGISRQEAQDVAKKIMAEGFKKFDSDAKGADVETYVQDAIAKEFDDRNSASSKKLESIVGDAVARAMKEAPQVDNAALKTDMRAEIEQYFKEADFDGADDNVFEKHAQAAVDKALKLMPQVEPGVSLEKAKEIAQSVVGDALKSKPEGVTLEQGKKVAEDALRKAVKDVPADTGSLHIGNTDFEAAVAKYLDANGISGTALTSIKSDVATLKGDVQGLTTKVDDMNSDAFAKRLFEKMQALNEFATWQTQFVSKINKYQAAGATPEGTAKLTAELGQRLDQLEKNLDASVKDMQELKPEFNNMQEGYKAVLASKDALEKLGDVDRAIEDIREQVAKVVGDVDSNAPALENRVERLHDLIMHVQRNVLTELDRKTPAYEVNFDSASGKNADLQAMVKQLVDKYQYGDRDGQIDWFAVDTGGSVLKVNTPRFGSTSFTDRVSETAIITPARIYRCFPVKGKFATIIIRTARGIVPKTFVYESPFASMNPAGAATAKQIEIRATSSKFMSGWTAMAGQQLDGLVPLASSALEVPKEGGPATLELDLEGQTSVAREDMPRVPEGTLDTQGFDLSSARLYDVFQIKILDNHGAEEVTCVWRVRIYGQGPSVRDWEAYKTWNW